MPPCGVAGLLLQVFRDHIIEVETSKSYPGLLTMYHLYTVDIICKGLPEAFTVHKICLHLLMLVPHLGTCARVAPRGIFMA
eukprot:3036306-Amphidinium_carterae.1